MKHCELYYTMDWIMISNLSLGIEIIALQWGSKDYPLHLVLLMKLDLIEDFLRGTFCIIQSIWPDLQYYIFYYCVSRFGC